ncbi:endonuclease G, mitochondrial-like [Pseudorasbora parva]|uniref:endonuclease G, mitochondrial-like n=1 Tax=Pseudorasbora parva TaxID=51549 RepID=UPI00351E74FB
MKKRVSLTQSSAEMDLSCIRIPFLKMSSNISDSKPVKDTSFVKSSYKLVDGFPRSSEIRIRKSYVMSYNQESKNADWVYEILNKDTLKENVKKQMSFGSNEMEDKVYEQGHLAAAANHRWCQEAYHDTFLLSNMVPQKKSLNKGVWKTFENYCRNKAMEDEVCNVHVYTGPLYLKEENRKLGMGDELEDMCECLDPKTLQRQGEKAVPTHFFKVIIVEKEDGTVEEPECYVMPKLDKVDTDCGFDKIDEVKNHYVQHILKFDEFFKLQLIEKHPDAVMRDCIKTVTWTGEGKNGELCSVNVKVRITTL